VIEISDLNRTDFKWPTLSVMQDWQMLQWCTMYDCPPGGSCWLRRRKAERTDVKNFILVEALSQHEAVLGEQSRVKVVHCLKESTDGSL